eukprot:857445-Karenia_brevis.AAC.1
MEGPVSSGHEQNIISQSSRFSMDRNHLLDPWPKIKRDKHHTEWASLRDATFMSVCSTQGPRNTIINKHVLNEVDISTQNLRG